MSVLVNGREDAAAAGRTLEEVVRVLGWDPARPGVALALNGTVVPRSTWPDRVLADGDRLEVVTAVQGG